VILQEPFELNPETHYVILLDKISADHQRVHLALTGPDGSYEVWATLREAFQFPTIPTGPFDVVSEITKDSARVSIFHPVETH
jgi:hypothetical protein